MTAQLSKIQVRRIGSSFLNPFSLLSFYLVTTGLLPSFLYWFIAISALGLLFQSFEIHGALVMEGQRVMLPCFDDWFNLYRIVLIGVLD